MRQHGVFRQMTVIINLPATPTTYNLQNLQNIHVSPNMFQPEYIEWSTMHLMDMVQFINLCVM